MEEVKVPPCFVLFVCFNAGSSDDEMESTSPPHSLYVTLALLGLSQLPP